MTDSPEDLDEVLAENARLRRRVEDLERPHGEETGTFRLDQLELLSAAALELIELRGDGIHRLLGRWLRELVGEAIVVVSEQVDAGRLVTRYVGGLGPRADGVMRLLGVDLEGLSFPYPEREFFVPEITNQLIDMPTDLHELTRGVIPKGPGRALTALVGIEAILSIDLGRGGRRFGNATLVLRRGQRVQNRPLVEALVRMVSVALHRRQVEQQLYEAQKLEAVGQLAGGVAHEFNNLLAAVLADASYLQARLEASRPAEVQECLGEIERAARRGAELTQDLLGFARKQSFTVQSVDVAHLFEEVLRVVTKTFDRSIDIRSEVKGPLWVSGDHSQLHQVMVNLCLNARDAMPSGGQLLLSGRKWGGRGGPREVVLTVTDTGCGMDRATRERVFEPFFTTKGEAGGTGLGLSVVFGIVRAHGGRIEVASSPGKGATFTVTLPAADSPPRPVPAPAPVVAGHGLALVVDDDRAVRRAAERLLRLLGFDVLSASDGDRAVELFRERSAEVRVVLLDLVMPNKSGAETFRELKRVRPDVKVLVTSGYDERRGGEQLLSEGANGFLRKPFDAQALGAALSSILADDAREDATSVGSEGNPKR